MVQMHKKILVPIVLPWLLAELVAYNPLLSYVIAWLGSFLIFHLSLQVPFRYQHFPLHQQIMRPLILIQLIFAGFMCCSSIFYFVDHLGYSHTGFNENSFFLTSSKTALIAKCQRLALLAHIGLAYGLILGNKGQYLIKFQLAKPGTAFLIKLCTISYGLALVLNEFPALIQFKYNLTYISISSGSLVFVAGIVRKNLPGFLFGSSVCLFNLVQASLSGYKEAIIVQLILLLFLLFPHYKKITLLLLLPILYLCMYILPTFSSVIRAQSWISKKTEKEASMAAVETFFDTDKADFIVENNWLFLTNRFSEIDMFSQFVAQTPSQRPYSPQILSNAMQALIPKALWPDKPSTEYVAMQRVYEYGVIQKASAASAKTRPIVDAYLIGGPIVVFVAMLWYGLTAQWLCQTAERLFGGYQLGCIVIFNGIFQQLWRGNTFEFLFNNILYGYLLMYLIFIFLKLNHILIPVKSHENTTHQSIL